MVAMDCIKNLVVLPKLERLTKKNGVHLQKELYFASQKENILKSHFMKSYIFFLCYYIYIYIYIIIYNGCIRTLQGIVMKKIENVEYILERLTRFFSIIIFVVS